MGAEPPLVPSLSDGQRLPSPRGGTDTWTCPDLGPSHSAPPEVTTPSQKRPTIESKNNFDQTKHQNIFKNFTFLDSKELSGDAGIKTVDACNSTTVTNYNENQLYFSINLFTQQTETRF